MRGGEKRKKNKKQVAKKLNLENMISFQKKKRNGVLFVFKFFFLSKTVFKNCFSKPATIRIMSKELSFFLISHVGSNINLLFFFFDDGFE